MHRKDRLTGPAAGLARTLRTGHAYSREVNARGVIAGGLLVTAAVVSGQAASQWIDFRVFHLGLRLLDSNHHASIFGGLSLLAQACAVAAIILHGCRSDGNRLLWLLLGVVVAVLLVMRVFTAYEPATIIPGVVVIVALLGWLTSHEPVAVRLVIAASIALLGCSFVLHSVGLQSDAAAPQLNDALAYQLTGIVKHGSELAGWMLLATGLAAATSTLRRLS